MEWDDVHLCAPPKPFILHHLHCIDLRCGTVGVHEANGKLVAQQDVSGHGTGVEPQGPRVKVSHIPPFLSMKSVRLVCCSPKALRQRQSPLPEAGLPLSSRRTTRDERPTLLKTRYSQLTATLPLAPPPKPFSPWRIGPGSASAG